MLLGPRWGRGAGAEGSCGFAARYDNAATTSSLLVCDPYCTSSLWWLYVSTTTTIWRHGGRPPACLAACVGGVVAQLRAPLAPRQ